MELKMADVIEKDEIIVDDELKIEEENPLEDSSENGEENPPEDEVVIEIEGEESPPQEESSVIKGFRQRDREKSKRIRELESQLTREKEDLAVLGPKPTLEGSDHDVEDFERKYAVWQSKKVAHDAKAAKKENDRKNQDEAWQNQLSNHSEKATALGVKDFDDVTAILEEKLSVVQLGIIIQGADDSAKVMYAISKNPKVLGDLSKIKDPSKFAISIGKLESKLKVTKRTPSTKPEKTLDGSGGSLSGGKATLDKLHEDAAKTGDYSKVAAYIQKNREK